MVIHYEEALYQVYAPLPLPYLPHQFAVSTILHICIINSAKEVMFSSSLVCLLAGLHKNYSTKFSQNLVERWQMATEETIRYWR